VATSTAGLCWGISGSRTIADVHDFWPKLRRLFVQEALSATMVLPPAAGPTLSCCGSGSIEEVADAVACDCASDGGDGYDSDDDDDDDGDVWSDVSSSMVSLLLLLLMLLINNS
jgi:hypothetical protein